MEPSLVILAAGMGSRYGGLKQIDGVGPGGESIIDYTIYDAIQIGYGSIVFVIRESFKENFADSVIKKIPSVIRAECVFQEIDHLPKGDEAPSSRTKPWGTGHALWCAKKVLKTPFAVVNADDFYGRESLSMMYNQLTKFDEHEPEAAMVGFRLDRTLSDNGGVSRGICELDENKNLISIVERTEIAKGEDGKCFYKEDDKRFSLFGDEMTSMNLNGFSPAVFEVIEEGFTSFFEQNKESLTAEYYLPDVLKALVERGIEIPVLSTSEEWFGVTYKEDKPVVQNKILDLIRKGIYPEKLWN